MSDIKYMNIKKFMDDGYLLEVNRCFFHPLGLALSVSVDNDTGEYKLHEIWDNSDDPEGIVFDEINEDDIARIEAIEVLRQEKLTYRLANLGYGIQPYN